MEKIKKTSKPDLATNLDFPQSLKRLIIGLLLPVFVLLIDSHLMIWAAPVMMYLFICASTHFDAIKWLWLRWRKKPEPNMNETWDEE